MHVTQIKMSLNVDTLLVHVGQIHKVVVLTDQDVAFIRENVCRTPDVTICLGGKKRCLIYSLIQARTFRPDDFHYSRGWKSNFCCGTIDRAKTTDGSLVIRKSYGNDQTAKEVCLHLDVYIRVLTRLSQEFEREKKAWKALMWSDLY